MPNLKPHEVTDLLRKCSVSHVCAGCPLEGMSKCDEELMKQAAEVIDDLSAMVPRWISVDERKPDKELARAKEKGKLAVEVIIQHENCAVTLGHYFGGAEFLADGGFWVKVSHWMPKPLPKR